MQFCAPQSYGYAWCKNHEEEVAVNIDKRPLRLGIPLLLLVPILGMALGLVVCWLNNARNSLRGLAEHGSVGHLSKMGDEPCVVASQRNFS